MENLEPKTAPMLERKKGIEERGSGSEPAKWYIHVWSVWTPGDRARKAEGVDEGMRIDEFDGG
jgi:hypothetical protein